MMLDPDSMKLNKAFTGLGGTAALAFVLGGALRPTETEVQLVPESAATRSAVPWEELRLVMLLAGRQIMQ